ncbi:hypothetical protein B0H13DRAFT_1893889 [Mycena leptocephala]|nr:hypothetical protein B0H13DRAFT_1893889 [Mycena leptocephala]
MSASKRWFGFAATHSSQVKVYNPYFGFGTGDPSGSNLHAKASQIQVNSLLFAAFILLGLNLIATGAKKLANEDLVRWEQKCTKNIYVPTISPLEFSQRALVLKTSKLIDFRPNAPKRHRKSFPVSVSRHSALENGKGKLPFFVGTVQVDPDV